MTRDIAHSEKIIALDMKVLLGISCWTMLKLVTMNIYSYVVSTTLVSDWVLVFGAFSVEPTNFDLVGHFCAGWGCNWCYYCVESRGYQYTDKSELG